MVRYPNFGQSLNEIQLAYSHILPDIKKDDSSIQWLKVFKKKYKIWYSHPVCGW